MANQTCHQRRVHAVISGTLSLLLWLTFGLGTAQPQSSSQPISVATDYVPLSDSSGPHVSRYPEPIHGADTTAPPSLSIDTPTSRRWWIPLPEGMFPPITGRTPESHRHLGLGTPLSGPELSWSALSHTAGFYMGGMDGAQSINSHLEHQLGTTLGMRFGLDYDYHWGVEKRFGFASLQTRDSFSQLTQKTELEFGDLDLYFYPWGDSRWRPFIMGGIGLSHYNHEDAHEHLQRYLLTSPFGIGLKRLVNNGVDLRIDITDNLMLGSGPVGTLNNMSLSAGAEFRYKGFSLIRSKPMMP